MKPERLNTAQHEGERANMLMSDFLKSITRQRKTNTKAWHVMVAKVEGRMVRLKYNNKWTQILEVDGVKVPTDMGNTTVKQWKHEIRDGIRSIPVGGN